MKNPQKEVEMLEKEIQRNKQKLAKLRRRVPMKPVQDYSLSRGGTKPVKLSSLFGKKSSMATTTVASGIS